MVASVWTVEQMLTQTSASMAVELKRLQLDTKGKKADRIGRLRAHIEAQPGAAAQQPAAAAAAHAAGAPGPAQPPAVVNGQANPAAENVQQIVHPPLDVLLVDVPPLVDHAHAAAAQPAIAPQPAIAAQLMAGAPHQPVVEVPAALAAVAAAYKVTPALLSGVLGLMQNVGAGTTAPTVAPGHSNMGADLGFAGMGVGAPVPAVQNLEEALLLQMLCGAGELSGFRGATQNFIGRLVLLLRVVDKDLAKRITLWPDEKKKALRNANITEPHMCFEDMVQADLAGPGAQGAIRVTGLQMSALSSILLAIAEIALTKEHMHDHAFFKGALELAALEKEIARFGDLLKSLPALESQVQDILQRLKDEVLDTFGVFRATMLNYAFEQQDRRILPAAWRAPAILTFDAALSSWRQNVATAKSAMSAAMAAAAAVARPTMATGAGSARGKRTAAPLAETTKRARNSGAASGGIGDQLSLEERKSCRQHGICMNALRGKCIHGDGCKFRYAPLPAPEDA